MGGCVSRAKPRGAGTSSAPRLRRRPCGAEVGADVPEAVGGLLLYLTLWAPPPRRVSGTNRWVAARARRLRRSIARGEVQVEALLAGTPPRPGPGPPPEVAMAALRGYLRRLPGRLLQDAAAWHALGHQLLRAAGPTPWHHHAPHAFLARVTALRRALPPPHNLLLDQLAAAARASGGTRPADVFAAAQFWAPALVRPPTPAECAACAFLHERRSSLGVAHALYYLARFSLAVHEFPFSGLAARGTAAPSAAPPRGETCDVCGEHRAP